jgi:hypothetical protein
MATDAVERIAFLRLRPTHWVCPQHAALCPGIGNPTCVKLHRIIIDPPVILRGTPKDREQPMSDALQDMVFRPPVLRVLKPKTRGQVIPDTSSAAVVIFWNPQPLAKDPSRPPDRNKTHGDDNPADIIQTTDVGGERSRWSKPDTARGKRVPEMRDKPKTTLRGATAQIKTADGL